MIHELCWDQRTTTDWFPGSTGHLPDFLGKLARRDGLASRRFGEGPAPLALLSISISASRPLVRHVIRPLTSNNVIDRWGCRSSEIKARPSRGKREDGVFRTRSSDCASLRPGAGQQHQHPVPFQLQLLHQLQFPSRSWLVGNAGHAAKAQ
ncbi:hypothetical protein LI328DRAFT_133887 [Trichoderma asperelloides]|nr:hypothetical protein LI328DRAFT_133887 [Trichoderma asperelloides]